MILQNIVWQNTEMPNTEELYYHSSAPLQITEQGMCISSGNSVSFDTYFNTFFCKNWTRYTTVKKVNIAIDIEGTGCICLIGDNQKTICKKCFSKAEKIQFQIDIQKYEYCYLTIQSDDNTIVKCAFIAALETPSIASPVKIALVTCTYNRQEDIKRNIKIIKTRNKETKTIEHIYIVDNAKNLKPEDFECETITLIPNHNTGGAGGFTRGMQEAMKRNDFTHILLMDDDVCIEFEAFCRTKALLSYIKPEFKENFVGGAMLKRDIPWVLHAQGEVWRNGIIFNPYHNSDVRSFDTVHKISAPIQDQPSHAAWWYCCIPKLQIEQKGYPIPFFLHCDDVEYSLRSGTSPIFLNGISIWHESFEDKRSSIIEYYDTRNALITNAIYTQKYGVFQAIYFLLNRYFASILRYRYGDVALLEKAVTDFLIGPLWLYEINSETLHKSLTKYNYVMKPVKRIPIFKKHPTKGRGYAIFRYLLPAIGTDTLRIGATVSEYAGKRKILLVDPKTSKGFVVRKSWIRTFQCAGSFCKYSFKILLNYNGIRKKWLQKMQKNFQNME